LVENKRNLPHFDHNANSSASAGLLAAIKTWLRKTLTPLSVRDAFMTKIHQSVKQRRDAIGHNKSTF
jgi:hypothetical protein